MPNFYFIYLNPQLWGITHFLTNFDASVKSTLPTRFWSVASATARADSWFLLRFLDFWRLHQFCITSGNFSCLPEKKLLDPPGYLLYNEHCGGKRRL